MCIHAVTSLLNVRFWPDVAPAAEVGAVRVVRKCDGDPECAAGEDIIEFQNPAVRGRPVDWCLRFGSGCGGDAADHFCLEYAEQRVEAPSGQQYTGADHRPSGFIRKSNCGETTILEGGICTPIPFILQCDCFSHIDCVTATV